MSYLAWTGEIGEIAGILCYVLWILPSGSEVWGTHIYSKEEPTILILVRWNKYIFPSVGQNINSIV